MNQHETWKTMSMKSQKYSIFTISDSTYFRFTEVFLKSLFSKLNTDKIEKVFICDLGHTDEEKKFITSFDRVQLIQPIKKIDVSKNLWDTNWLNKVGSKTENLLKLLNNRVEPIVMIDVDSMFIKDFYDLLDFNYDIQVTHRPFHEFKYIASFFSVNNKAGKRFIESWIENIKTIPKKPKETRAMCQTIKEFELTNPDFKIGKLPVEQIHFYDKEKFVETNDTRIAHFKTWKHKYELGTKEDFEHRIYPRGYQERLKEYIDVQFHDNK